MNISLRISRTASQRSMRGFAYLFLLFALAVMGLLLAAFGQNWSTTTQREREAELVFIGKQFSAALASYRARSIQGTPIAPATLDELLEDKRFPFPVRHLRQIFRDPMTGKRDWEAQLVDGRIIGVRSHSQKTVIRKKLPDYVAMATDVGQSPVYHDWLFTAAEDAAAPAASSAPLPSPSGSPVNK
jgi:type II secretory pathway pseudopilin PulG